MFATHRYADILTVVEDRVSGCKGAKETQLPVKVLATVHIQVPLAEFESRQFPPELSFELYKRSNTKHQLYRI